MVNDTLEQFKNENLLSRNTSKEVIKHRLKDRENYWMKRLKTFGLNQ